VIFLGVDIEAPGVTPQVRSEQVEDTANSRLWGTGECTFCERWGGVCFLGTVGLFPGFPLPMHICVPCLRRFYGMATAYSEAGMRPGGVDQLNYPEWRRRRLCPS